MSGDGAVVFVAADEANHDNANPQRDTVCTAEHMMSRLWWFCLWLWEWFWHPQGMLVWVETNQGAISVLALISAFLLARIEQQRANLAEARAAKLARDLEESAQRRAEDEILREQQNATAADERARVEARTARQRRIMEYVGAASTMIRDLYDLGLRTRSELAAEGDLTEPRAEPRNWTLEVVRTRDALSTLIGIAPADPKLLMATQQAITALQILRPPSSRQGWIRLIDTANEEIQAARIELSDRQLWALNPANDMV